MHIQYLTCNLFVFVFDNLYLMVKIWVKCWNSSHTFQASFLRGWGEGGREVVSGESWCSTHGRSCFLDVRECMDCWSIMSHFFKVISTNEQSLLLNRLSEFFFFTEKSKLSDHYWIHSIEWHSTDDRKTLSMGHRRHKTMYAEEVNKRSKISDLINSIGTRFHEQEKVPSWSLRMVTCW